MARKRDRRPLSELEGSSLALQNFRQQDTAIRSSIPLDQAAIDALTGDEDGPMEYNLTTIWRAALADETNPEPIGRRRYMSPKRYVHGWRKDHVKEDHVKGDDGAVMVDVNSAWHYCMLVDDRLISAAVDLMTAARKQAASIDPIGNAVNCARGGGIAMMMARVDAREHGWTDDRDFNRAVMDRAKEEAATMDDYSAERLVSEVRQALESGPRIVFVSGFSA
jgi:hypothetical protein